MTSMVAMSGLQWLMMVVLFLVCVLLMLVVLIQKGRGGGLAGAFGGGGGASSAFGSKTGDVFTGITVALAAVYLLLTVFGNYVLRPDPVQAASANVSAPMGAPTGAPPTDGTTPALPATPAAPAATDTGSTPPTDVTPIAPPAIDPPTSTGDAPAEGSTEEGDSGDES